MAEQIIINEFSLRLEIIPAQDDVWHYRNLLSSSQNLSRVDAPLIVKQAICDGAFCVTASNSNHNPALMGRVILDWQDGIHWSIIAVLTYNRNYETQEHFADYRFFLCQGANKLWQLIDWLETEHQRLGEFPSFESLTASKPSACVKHIVQSSNPPFLSERAQAYIRFQSLPITLLTESSYTLKEVHQIALSAAMFQHHLVSWAVGIDMPESCSQFYVIRFSNSRAYEAFQNRRLVPFMEDLYPLLLPRLWEEFEEFICKEIKKQSFEAVPTGTRVDGYYQQELLSQRPSLTAEALIAWYNNSPDELLAYIYEVALTSENYQLTMRKNLSEIHFKLERGGYYWIVSAPAPAAVEAHGWLVPQATRRITPYRYQEVISHLFECTNYQENEAQLFKVLRPAKVRLLPNKHTWKFMEAGALRFESSR